MPQYLYSAWFLDNEAELEDQDREWVACIIIDAETAEDARLWGDRLANDFVSRHSSNDYTSSNVEIASEKDESNGNLPHIAFGEEDSDKAIGW